MTLKQKKHTRITQFGFEALPIFLKGKPKPATDFEG